MTRKRSAVEWGGLALWLAITFAAAAIGSLGSRNSAGFYSDLVQPSWAPPSSVFGPVWTTLYALMAIAAWLVWRERAVNRDNVARSLGFFIAQLLLNTLWSWLFFAWHEGALAFWDIIALWILIVVTLVLFWRVHPLAGLLLLPYLIWVTFAAVLNFTTWRLNPQVLG